jgi:hypothetical protein
LEEYSTGSIEMGYFAVLVGAILLVLNVEATVPEGKQQPTGDEDICVPLCQTLQDLRDASTNKYTLPSSSPILYYRMIVPDWLKYYTTYYNQQLLSTNKRQMEFSTKQVNFPRYINLPIFYPGYFKETEDIIVSVKASFKTPTRDSDIYIGVCSGDYCYGLVVTDTHQKPPACPFRTWHSGDTWSQSINAVCTGSSRVTNTDYPEEFHFWFYPRLGWGSYTVAQNGGTSVVGTYQNYPNLAAGLSIEVYGDDEDNERVNFQYMEIEVRRNY